jgi:predicted transposase YbfD/YdcC
MENLGIEKEEWLRTFLALPNGIPDSDTFRRVFEKVNPQELSEVLRNWLEFHREKRSVVSVDGKTIRGSKGDGHKAYHVVSAFVRENRITLGKIKTDEKSNEITAVPELLEMLDLKDAIVTADAMSCQTKIAARITEKEADYVISLKGNQSTLLGDVKLFFEDFTNECTHSRTLEKGHGRIEKREYFLSTEIEWLSQKADWANLNALGAVKSSVEEKGEIRLETRFFITSLTNIEEFSQAVREHWGIENQLHWCLDVIFREDTSRARRDNSPLNLNVLRKTALPLLQAANFGRIGIRKKMFRAALSIPSLDYILTGKK